MKTSRTDVLKIWVPAVVIVALGFALAYASLDPPPPSHVRIATGPKEGAYWAFAQRYREIMGRQGVELELVATAGSGDNAELIAGGKVDLALLQGGTASGAPPGRLESLASLFLEPVWVFYRADLDVDRLVDLEGRRVAVGVPGSGTRALALRLLAASGLDSGNTKLLEIPSSEAVTALDEGTADAAVFVASIRASYVSTLLADDRCRLLSFRRHRAYGRFFPFLTRVVLGEGVVDLRANVPSQDVSLLAAAASLVARADLHPGLIPLLLETAREVHGPGTVFEAPGEFPSTRWVELPMSPEARLYLERGPSFLYRFLSFRVATAIDRLKILILPFITLLIPLFRVAPPLYRWRIRSRIYRWYEDLRRVDEDLDAEPSAEKLRAHAARLRQLEQEVTDEVSVPLSYMDEFYRLRDHIDLILRKLEKYETESGARDGKGA